MTVTNRNSITPKILGPADNRKHNRAVLLKVLYRRGHATRAELSRITGMSRVTVSEVVTDLLEAGLIREAGTITRKGTLGRAATMLEVASDDYFIICADLSKPNLVCMEIRSLQGDCIARHEVVVEDFTREIALSHLMEEIAWGVERIPGSAHLLGIGIAVPGIVDMDGVVLRSEFLEWTNVPIRALVHERFGVNVYVENDANASALAEHISSGTMDLVLIYLGSGIGIGSIVDGRVVRGTHFAAGEIAYVVTEHGVLLNQQLADMLEQLGKAISLPQAHASIVQDIELEIARLLTRTIAVVVAASDPEELVISGTPASRLESIAGLVEQNLHKAFAHSQTHVRIRPGELGNDSALIGVHTLVLRAHSYI